MTVRNAYGMQRYLLTLPGFNGVAANSLGTLACPMNLRYHNIFFRTNATFDAEFTLLTVKVNAQPIMTFTPADLDYWQQYHGFPPFATNNMYVIPFDRSHMHTRAGNEETALNCSVPGPDGIAIRTLTIEIQFAGGAITPQILEVIAECSDPVRDIGGPGSIRRVIPYTRTAGGAGILEIPDFQFGSSALRFIQSVHFNTGLITALRILRKNIPIAEFGALATISQVNAGTARGHFPQAGWVVYDTSRLGYGANDIPLDTMDRSGSNLPDGTPILVNINDLRFLLTVSGAGSIPTLVEYMGSLN